MYFGNGPSRLYNIPPPQTRAKAAPATRANGPTPAAGGPAGPGNTASRTGPGGGTYTPPQAHSGYRSYGIILRNGN